MSGTKTSVWLAEDIAARWKASGIPLAELVRRGLNAGEPEPVETIVERAVDRAFERERGSQRDDAGGITMAP